MSELDVEEYCENCGEKFIGKLDGWIIITGKLYHDKCELLSANQVEGGGITE
jgi:hypothetical protein